MEKDFSGYKYARLLDYFHRKYEEYSSRIDCSELLLTMDNASSLEEILQIYEKCYNELCYINNFKEPKMYLVHLNSCVNDNIVRLICSKTNPSIDDLRAGIANLRDVSKIDRYIKEICKHGEVLPPGELDLVKNHIVEIQNNYFVARYSVKNILSSDKESIDYKETLHNAKQYLESLKEYGYIITSADIDCKDEITDNKENKINFMNIISIIVMVCGVVVLLPIFILAVLFVPHYGAALFSGWLKK